MANCRDGHETNVRGYLSLRWCPECSRFELRVWAKASEGDIVQTLIPEWADVVRLEDDEWLARTLAKYVTGLAQVTRTLENDERSGQLRLL